MGKIKLELNGRVVKLILLPENATIDKLRLNFLVIGLVGFSSVFDDGGAEVFSQPSEGICSVSSKHLIQA